MVKHRDVKAFRRLQRSVLFKYIPSDAMAGDDVEEAIKKALVGDPEKLAEFSTEMEDVEEAGTIMLAFSLSYEEIQNMDEEEFQIKLEGARKKLGGGASDFLASFSPGTTSRPPPSRSGTLNQRKVRNGSGTSNGLCEERKGQKKSRK